LLRGLFKFIYTVLSAALPLVLFTMPYKVVLTFESRWMKSLSVTIQMKGSTEQFFSCGSVYNAIQGGCDF